MTERRDTQEQAEFREYCRRWLEANRPPAPDFRMPVSAIEISGEKQRLYFSTWQKKCHAAGLVGADYPKEYGGGGHKGFQQIASQELDTAPFMMNVIGP
jgi:alkylation response protein AidB-like acyl-CoA dehydrogenase